MTLTRFGHSLHGRLWLMIVLALAPVFGLVFMDYRTQQAAAVAQVEQRMAHMLAMAREREQSGLSDVRKVLQIMAGSDNLRTLDPQDCSGIAERLARVFTELANLGMALPDGTIVCSAFGPSPAIRVADRAWFQEAVRTPGLTHGQFVTQGRLSGRPGLVFGYALRDADGTLRGVLFAASRLDWFDQLMRGLRLPEGWRATLATTAGDVVARFPHQAKPGRVPPEHLRALLDAVRQGRTLVELHDPDGQARLHGVAPAGLGRNQLFLSVEAPVEQSQARIAEAFGQRLSLLGGIILLCLFGARLFVYLLIERRAVLLLQTLRRLAAGDLGARLDSLSSVHEIAQLEHGINQMADELQRRDADLQRLSRAVQQSPHGVIVTDTDANIVYVNDAFERTTGYRRDEAIGHNVKLLDAGVTPDATFTELWETLLQREVWQGEFINRRKDGSCYPVFAIVGPVRNAQGQVINYVAIEEDVSARKASEVMLHRLAHFDVLTGLPNRALLKERLAHALLTQARRPGHGALMLFDLDRFKLLNETQGHAAGDHLLREMAHRLREAVREEDTVARHGDDDFALLIEDLGQTEAEAVAHAEEMARKLHSRLTAEVELQPGGGPYYPALSVGIALFHGRENGADALLKQAEVALYRAKEEGRNLVRFFRPDIQAAVDARARIEFGLRDALARQEFRLYYQVQTDAEGRLRGAEALIRWQRADGTLVSPAEFIPVAEETGLIVPMGLWVLDTALEHLARWQRRTPAFTHSIAVNVSARQFHQPDFVDQVRQRLQRSGIDPAGLKLELTESVVLGEVGPTVERMEALRALGLRFALDDFGSGYSSLSYLKRLPFDQLKIDQSFVHDMLEGERDNAIVRAILSMSQTLGLEVVAEGVETEAQRDFLQAHGCARFQGYLMGRPMPAEAWAAQWLEPPV